VGTWKKILVEGDNTNLGSSNLTQSDAARTYTVSGTTSSLSIKSHHGGNLAQFVSGAVNSANDLVTFSAGVVEVAGSASAGSGTLRIIEASGNGTNYVNLTVPNLTSTYTVTLPAASPGGNNKILESDSNGDLSWITTPSGGGGSTTINNNADNKLITGSGTANTLEAESNLQYNASSNILTVNGQAKINDIFISGQGISSTGDIGIGSRSAIVGSSSTTTAGRVHYYTSVGAWAAASNSVEAHNASLIAIARGGSNSNGMCLEGFIKPDIYNSSNSSTTFALGKAVYLNSNGTVTTDVPSTSGVFARILGYATGTTIMYFRPSNEYVEIA
jgi:hypothetical protein